MKKVIALLMVVIFSTAVFAVNDKTKRKKASVTKTHVKDNKQVVLKVVNRSSCSAADSVTVTNGGTTIKIVCKAKYSTCAAAVESVTNCMNNALEMLIAAL
jgi:hypothetical protein